jgi:putative acetyltransferase
VRIREAVPADATAIADLHIDSIRSLGPAFYAPAVVSAWAAVVTPAMYLSAMAGGEVFFVAQEHEQAELLGFSSHIPAAGPHGVSVYVRGTAARRGLGSSLLRVAEDRARAHGATQIEIQASLPGVAFYRANGFETVAPSDVVFDGQTIQCLTMRKVLIVRD